MDYIFAFFTGLFMAPFVYVQGYICIALESKNLVLKHRSHLFFLFVVLSFCLVLLAFTFPVKNWIYSQPDTIYFIGFYLFLFCICYEVYTFFLHGKKWKPLDVFAFTQLFVVVGGVYYTLISLNQDWVMVLLTLLGISLGFGLLFIFARNLYSAVLNKYCNPVLKNPILGLMISSFFMGIFSVIFHHFSL